MSKIRNIYIDCGAWTGDTIKEFKKHYNNYEIYGFECEPRLKNTMEKLSQELNFTFINKAVWIKDTTKSFYMGTKDRTQASTINKSKKKKIDKNTPVTVECIDFSRWIKDNFSPDDNIICKMNIEGAEYDILPKMISDETLKYIKKLYCAWHYNKLEGFDKKNHDSLINRLATITELSNWDYDERIGKNPF